MVTMFNDSDYVSAAPHSAALNVMHSEQVRVMDINNIKDKDISSKIDHMILPH